ncbi:MAG TPA: hypothetical protein VIF08_07225, partial [Candidatus Limnocylindrales bacterium]
MGRRSPRWPTLAIVCSLLGVFAWLAAPPAFAASVGATVTAADRPAAASPANSLALTATYKVRARIYWGRGAILVESTASVTNTTAVPVGRLTFNLVALVAGDAKVLEVTAGGARVHAEPKNQTIVVPLPAALAPGDRTNVTIRYRAQFNALDGSRQLLLGQADSVLTAYRWIPWLSRRQPFATPNFGESWVTAASPRVTVTLISQTPLIYATSGNRVTKRGHSQTFVARNVRDFNFSASPDYHVRRIAWRGVTVRTYQLTGSGDVLGEYAVDALKRFSEEVGPYAYPTLNVAEAPISSGMESPALAWISTSSVPEDLARLVAHEVAHQWFYAVVGNNQAQQPFADEAVATFLADTLLGSDRSSLCSAGRLDRSVYKYSRRCYPEVIYVQGALYLERYRTAVGNGPFWAGIRQYFELNRFGMGG